MKRNALPKLRPIALAAVFSGIALDRFYAYVEYCTSRWRAGGDTKPFPSRKDPETGRLELIGFPSGGKVYRWALTYDPDGNGGRGVVTATIDDQTAIANLEEGHKADGAVFPLSARALTSAIAPQTMPAANPPGS